MSILSEEEPTSNASVLWPKELVSPAELSIVTSLIVSPEAESIEKT